MSKIQLTESITTPSTPSAGKIVIYEDSSDKHIKTIDDSGIVSDLTNPTNSAVFGTSFQFLDSLGESTVTGTIALQNKLSLLTPTIPAGNYKIEWSFEWLINSDKDKFMSEVKIDAGSNIMDSNAEPKEKTSYYINSGFGIIALTNAIHTIDLNFGTSNIDKISKIRKSTLTIFRVS